MKMMSSAMLVPESTLIPILKKNFLPKVLPRKAVSKSYSIGEEIRSQYGIPDLVFYDFYQPVIQNRLNNNIKPVLSKEVIKTLLLIQNKKKITFTYLQHNLPFSKDVLKNKVIRYLIQNNYLNKSSKDYELYWVGDNIFQLCMQNMFAVEAKVSNWKRGFYQAYRYKWFSHYSFLALHERYIKPAAASLELFKQYNIGLVSVDTEVKNVNVFNKPKKEKPYSPEYAALTFEKLFAVYFEKKATSQLAASSRLII